MNKDPFDIIGDYMYDEPRRDEKFGTMQKIVETCVTRYMEQRDPPKRLILLRNGSS
jgi:hypothetical protein